MNNTGACNDHAPHWRRLAQQILGLETTLIERVAGIHPVGSPDDGWPAPGATATCCTRRVSRHVKSLKGTYAAGIRPDISGRERFTRPYLSIRRRKSTSSAAGALSTDAKRGCYRRTSRLASSTTLRPIALARLVLTTSPRAVGRLRRGSSRSHSRAVARSLPRRRSVTAREVAKVAVRSLVPLDPNQLEHFA